MAVLVYQDEAPVFLLSFLYCLFVLVKFSKLSMLSLLIMAGLQSFVDGIFYFKIFKRNLSSHLAFIV